MSVTGDRPPRGRRIWRGIPCAAASAFASFATAEAHAHGFGQRYDLPVPLWLYLTGAGLTVALSFVAMAVFLRARPAVRDVPGINLLNTRIGRVLAAAPLRFVLRLLGVLLYLLVVLAGLLGTQSPLKNIAPVMVWAIWWVGMAYVSALVGNVWALANPLDTLFVWLERPHARARFGRRLSLELPYPKRLGVWPAVALFLAFIWIELVWESTDVPAKLALAILAYSALTWLGMLVFGRHEWLRRGEVFAIVFGLLARFAPLEARTRDGRREWNLRPYGIGLLTSEPLHASEILLVILMLATVSFDGFIETPAWAAIAEAMIGPAPEAGPGLTDALPTATGDALVRTIGLIVAPLLFLSVYLIVCELMVRYGAPALLPSGARYGGRPVARAAGLFVLTLIPIAIAYHLSHYLSFLVTAAQYLVPLASDPLGRGWDLFGGARYFIRIGIVDARIVWYVSVAAIVAGHVAAVYLAHVLALREFPDRRVALRSQYPMLMLMVAYTMTSLWIIAQPIVSAGPR